MTSACDELPVEWIVHSLYAIPFCGDHVGVLLLQPRVCLVIPDHIVLYTPE